MFMIEFLLVCFGEHKILSNELSDVTNEHKYTAVCLCAEVKRVYENLHLKS